MRAPTILILAGLGAIVTLFWLLGAGALGTGDQPNGTIPGPAGDARSSPSVGTTGSLKSASSNPGANASASPAMAGAGANDSGHQNKLPPLVLVSPASIIPENVVVAAGQGFQPGELVDLAVEDANSSRPIAVASAMVDKDGNFYGIPITITTGTVPGDRSVVGRGRQSERQAEATIHVAASGAYGAPSTYSGKGGTEVTFQGGDFEPSEVVSLHFDSLAVDPLSQVIAGADGAVGISGTVPLADPGEHAFFLIGERSHNPVRIPFSVVAFSPWFAPTNYSPRPQERFGFVGHDFAPDEEVRFYRGKVADTPIAIAHADQSGQFTVDDAYELPVDAKGKDQLLAVGMHTRSVISVTVEVLPFSPSIELSEYAGRAGTTVSLKGSGFAHGETVTAYIGGVKGGHEVSRFQVGEDGTFDGAGTFTIPADLAAGNVTIATVGERSRVAQEVSFAVLPFTPWLTLSRYAGPTGADVTFEGHDFLPGEAVTIHLGDRQSPTFGTAQADTTGSFYGGGKYTVPDNAVDNITFTAVGETSHGTATATFNVGASDGDQQSTVTPAETGDTDAPPPTPTSSPRTPTQ